MTSPSDLDVVDLAIEEAEKEECEAIAAYRAAAIALTYRVTPENFNRAMATHDVLAEVQARLLGRYHLRKRLERVRDT